MFRPNPVIIRFSSERVLVLDRIYAVMSAYLCWAGWLEEYGMIESVKVDFLYIEVFHPVGVLWIVMSR